MPAPKAPRPDRPDPRVRLFGGRLALFLLVGLVVLTAIRWLNPTDTAETIGYDQFLEAVRDGEVARVTIGPERIHGEYGTPEGREQPGADTASETTPREGYFVTGRLDDDDLVSTLEEAGVEFAAEAPSAWEGIFPWLMYLGLPLVLLVFLWAMMARRTSGPAGNMLGFGKSRGKLMEETDVRVTFEDVAGVPEAKDELGEIIEFLKSPEKYHALGAKIPKGVLLVGPPGTGKTLLARAVAGEASVPFISISGSDFVEMFVGVGAARVRDLFTQAAERAPCIVFIDELDAIGRSRSGTSGPGSNEEREQTLNQLLVEMDGFHPKEAVIIMAATNRPEVLDPALLRPGRFDRQVVVDHPDRKGREQILTVHARGLKLDDEVELSTLAARTPGFAGAELANLMNEAALLTARRDKEQIGIAELSEAIDRVVGGLERKSRLIGPEERLRIAYHESGHALAGVLAGSDEIVHKISIVPRGIGALGFTMQLPAEERYLMTKTEIEAKLIALLGGRAAEEVVFGEASTGAQNDLQKATDIARAMVTEYGMSERVGVVSIGRSGSPFLREAPGSALRGPTGEVLADTVDAEVRRIVEDARMQAVALLRANESSLRVIAELLIEREQLEGQELDALLDRARELHRNELASETEAAAE